MEADYSSNTLVGSLLGASVVGNCLEYKETIVTTATDIHLSQRFTPRA
jgi:hypothetical protein